MKKIGFHEFHQVLLEFIEESFPEAELYIIAGGDYVQDIVLELRLGEKKYRYTPYKLYQEGCLENDFEGVIDCFIKQVTKRLKCIIF